jgi:putative lipoic acid-binding regulatory protein
MRDLDDIQPESPDQGFQFPGEFEITALGRTDANLEQRVPQILEGIGLGVIAGSLRTRPSREGNYHAVSVTFTCPDREHYDGAHAALRADDAIRWTI